MPPISKPCSKPKVRHNREQHDAHEDDDEDETGSAPRMQSREPLCVLYVKCNHSFIGVDCLMLCAMVLEHSFEFAPHGDKREVKQKEGKTHRGFDNVENYSSQIEQ